MRKLAEKVDVVLVVGSKNSSNSNRLREVAQLQGTPAYLIDHAGEIASEWLAGVERVGITAGASAPEHLVTGVIQYLSGEDQVPVTELDGEEENICFDIPDLDV